MSTRARAEHRFHAFTIPIPALAGYLRCAYCPAVQALAPTPSVQGSATSEAAARAMTDERRVSDKARILAAIRASQTYGATDEELEAATGIKGSTLRPRRLELAKDQLIVQTGRTRRTRAGLEAVVWRAVQSGG